MRDVYKNLCVYLLCFIGALKRQTVEKTARAKTQRKSEVSCIKKSHGESHAKEKLKQVRTTETLIDIKANNFQMALSIRQMEKQPQHQTENIHKTRA